MRQQTCKQRIGEHYAGRIHDLREIFHAETHPREYCSEGTYSADGRLHEYGLSFDYVAPGTFNGQRRGYFRYQLSWGGPSDEFRFYCDENFTPERIEYWFLDWFDGAKRRIGLDTEDGRLLLQIWDWFEQLDVPRSEYARAMAD